MTKKISIKWLTDDTDCETCGISYAEGASVTITHENGASENLEFEPIAHCFDGMNFDKHDVYSAVLRHLGWEIVEAQPDEIPSFPIFMEAA